MRARKVLTLDADAVLHDARLMSEKVKLAIR